MAELAEQNRCITTAESRILEALHKLKATMLNVEPRTSPHQCIVNRDGVFLVVAGEAPNFNFPGLRHESSYTLIWSSPVAMTKYLMTLRYMNSSSARIDD